MADFTLDTSGVVALAEPVAGRVYWMWPDLSPFAQGYVRRAFDDIEWPDPNEGHGPSCSPRFDWLAPATLAAMLRDCETYSVPGMDTKSGEIFWRLRQAGQLLPFKPATLYLGEDGKIYQREGDRG